MSTIGERIKKVRDAKGYVQGYVADRLNVVHTTVGDYEKRTDLKISTAKRIAAVLEIDVKLLTDEPSDLDAADVTPIVRRESLRRFIKESSIQGRERLRFERIADHILAQTTVAGWHTLHDLISQFLGRSPDRRVTTMPGDEPSPAIGTSEPNDKKRMARVTIDRVNRSLRRVV